MPAKLDKKEVINVEVEDYEINAFATDLDRQEIVVSYDLKDATGAIVMEDYLTIDNDRFAASIMRAEEINAVSPGVYASLKQALYEEILAAKGKTATVS